MRKTPVVPHGSQRVARYLVAPLTSSRDPRTIADFARISGISQSQLRGYCRLSGLSPKRCLDFARLLRVVVQRSEEARHLVDLLDIADARTLAGLLRRAGISVSNFPGDVERFVLSQQLIQNPAVLREVLEFAQEHSETNAPIGLDRS
jgi:hypothetical protein